MTKEVLDEIIRRRHNEGKTLSVERINDEELTSSQIRERARKYYGGWSDALKNNGVTPFGQDYFSKEDTVKELRRLQSTGCRMRITDFEPKLVKSIQRHFGGYKKAKKELGIEIDSKVGGHNKRRLSDVIEELKAEYDNIDTKKDYREKCGRIYEYSRIHLGCPYKIFSKAGLDIPRDTPRKNTVWTDRRIKYSLEEAVRVVGTTSSNRLIKFGYGNMVEAVKRRYGTWNAGLVALGYEVAYEYRDPSNNLTKEETKENVLNALSKGVKPTREALVKEIKGLSRSIDVNFGGINELKRYCGFCAVSDKPAEELSKTYRPDLTTPEGIKREITRMWYIGAPMNYTYVKENRRHLLDEVNKRVGSWKKAIESIGLEYKKVTKNVSTNILSKCGTEFEYLFAEILNELGYEYSREGEGLEDIYPELTLKPDFILPNWRWIDCKLSEWTDIRETLVRYLSESPNGLTIVYLRGRNKRVNRGEKWKYEHVSVYQYTKLLPKDKREYYERRLRKIEEKADEGAVAK